MESIKLIKIRNMNLYIMGSFNVNFSTIVSPIYL